MVLYCSASFVGMLWLWCVLPCALSCLFRFWNHGRRRTRLCCDCGGCLIVCLILLVLRRTVQCDILVERRLLFFIRVSNWLAMMDFTVERWSDDNDDLLGNQVWNREHQVSTFTLVLTDSYCCQETPRLWQSRTGSGTGKTHPHGHCC